jgi:archaemetzincin
MKKNVFSLNSAITVLALFVLLTAVHGQTEKVKFLPPNEESRIKAIGSTERLSEELKKAFEPGKDFRPMGRPRPDEWLAEHEEKGETYDQYVRSMPNFPDLPRIYIYLLPLGRFGNEEEFLANLKEFTSLYFCMEVKLLPVLDMKELKVRSRTNTYTKKQQLNCEDIQEKLKERLPVDAYCLLGITMSDLYPGPDWNYVFGWAAYKQRVGVFSFARFDPTFWEKQWGKDYEKILLSRSCRLVSHEIGHMFGMRHCIYYRCNMNGMNSIEESDRQSAYLCPVCLRKLHYVLHFDVIDRYKNLYFFYKKTGLLQEASWFKRRLTTLLREEKANNLFDNE